MNGKVYKKNYNKLTKEEVRSLDELKINSKFLSSTYNNVIPLKIYGIKGKWNLIFKCTCREYFSIEKSRLSYLSVNGGLENIHCGCIDENEEKIKIEEAKSTYYNKQPHSETNKHWCTYCESYRDSLSKVGDSNYCNSCKFLIKNSVSLGKSFEDIMLEWDPTCHKIGCKRLPYLRGNSKKGYKIAGFTYVDNDIYKQASKILWVKGAPYVNMNLSKDNCKRLGITKPAKSTYIFLHRYVLGLGNSVNMFVGDHISGLRLDNRFNNLRIANPQENALNSVKKFNKDHHTSIYKGVSFNLYNGKWRALCEINKVRYCKLWDNEIDAAKHYDDILRTKHPSEYNRYNFPQQGELPALVNKGL